MEIRLGRFPAQLERPETIKFAWPIMLVPELFTTNRHLAVLLGYLATIGWEVYAPDYRAVNNRGGASAAAGAASGGIGFEDMASIAAEAAGAIGPEVIVLGYGFGGSLALKLGERPGIKAAVALAPMVPAYRTPLVMRAANLPAIWLGRALKPPRGRALFDLLLDVEPFQREALIRNLVPDVSRAPVELSRGDVEFAPADRSAPRLIVAGDSDPFAPAPQLSAFAQAIGARLSLLRGRGHWLIGGRALERAIAEAHRFLVHSLGEDLLLLYPEEWRDDPERGA